MTNEPSKQICEICGIKLVYKCTYTGDLCPYKYEGILKPRCPKQGIPKECEVRRKIDYIDFSEPENFVKLFKLITTAKDVDFSTGLNYNPNNSTYIQQSVLNTYNRVCYSPNTNPIKAFLECVKLCVEDNKNIAKCIREAEWKYE